MTIIIRIETVTDAFADFPATEIGRILRDLALRYEQDGIVPESTYDSNGNTVCFISEVD